MTIRDSVYYKCSVCGKPYIHNPAVKTHFGSLPVSFCYDCFDQTIDLVKQEIAPAVENFEQQELMEELRGRRRIVINTCHGGFSLSHQASIRYLELAGIEYKLEPRGDRDSQTRLGPVIMVNGLGWHYYSIERDDPRLVSVVKELGAAANGEFASLKVVTIPANVAWEIEEYDGREWIAEQHRVWR